MSPPHADRSAVLQAMWQRGLKDEFTPQSEQEIVEQVRKVSAERRMRRRVDAGFSAAAAAGARYECCGGRRLVERAAAALAVGKRRRRGLTPTPVNQASSLLSRH